MYEGAITRGVQLNKVLKVGVAVALVAVVAAPASGAPRKTAKKRSDARVVVAVVDSAVNPYHEYYSAGGSLYGTGKPSSVTPAVLKEFGIEKDHIIKLTRTGNFLSDFAKDKAQFDAIEAGEPYWFEGTNVIGISFSPAGKRLRPDGSDSPHGVGTTAAVLGANPEAIIVSVDGINENSEKWAFTHPAVDIVTTSYGPPVPTLSNLSSSYTGVVKNGKAHFGAATNDPQYAGTDATSGPWWTIGIAGFQEGETEGRQLSSGSFPDFVGDFSQELPYCRSCEDTKRVVRGTSFATPRSAGTFSKILLEARRAVGHTGGVITKGVKSPQMVGGSKPLTVWEMRRALELGAYYPTTTDFKPGTDTSTPILDVAPWLQAGWGAITPDNEHEVIKQTLAHLGFGGKADRKKSEAACDFQTAHIEIRHAYFDNVAIFSESFGQSEDPYIYC